MTAAEPPLIPTEPIGTVPRPLALIAAETALAREALGVR